MLPPGLGEGLVGALDDALRSPLPADGRAERPGAGSQFDNYARLADAGCLRDRFRQLRRTWSNGAY